MLPVSYSYYQMVAALLGCGLAHFQALSRFQQSAELTADLPWRSAAILGLTTWQLAVSCPC